jgi:hypothetical protein
MDNRTSTDGKTSHMPQLHAETEEVVSIDLILPIINSPIEQESSSHFQEAKRSANA